MVVTVSSLVSLFVRVGGESGWSLYPLLSLCLLGWMVSQGSHCIFSYLSVCPGGRLFMIVIVSSPTSLLVRVDGKSGWSLIPLLPLHWSGWMVNQGGHCILSCLYIGPGGW